MRNKLNDIKLKSFVSLENIKARISGYLKDEKGAGTVEYALVISVIVVGLLGLFWAFSGEFTEIFKGIVGKIKESAGL